MENNQNQQQEEGNILYFLRLVIQNWKLLLGLYLSVGILTVIILLLLPKWYKSETTIVILEENQSAISQLASEFSSLGLGLSAGLGVDTYTEYIYTKKMYNRLIDEFDLMKEYEVEFREDAYAVMKELINVADNENYTFTVSYLYKEDPVKAKEIVEFIFSELDKIALEVDKAAASNFRNYIEDYYRDTEKQLEADEDSLARFQARTGVLDLQTQLEATIQGLAELELQKVALEIERNYIQRSYQSSNKVEELTSQIEAIAEKIDELKRSQSVALVSIEGIPAKGADYLRLRRDIEIGSQVSEFLRLQYEQALLDEQKINSNLYMLDPPRISEKKYKPQRTKILFLVMFFTGILSLIFIRFKDYYQTNEEYIKSLLSST